MTTSARPSARAFVLFTSYRLLDRVYERVPRFLEIWDREGYREQTFTEVRMIEVEENYIRESILEPQARIVAGYEPVMPTYQGRLSDPEIMAIIEYFKSLDGTSSEE